MNRELTRMVQAMACALVILLSAGGCGVACPLGVEPGLEVEVFDAGTNAPLAAGALALVYAGEAVVDTLRAYEPAESARILVAHRTGAGRYTARIAHEGYAPWQQADVIVRRAETAAA